MKEKINQAPQEITEVNVQRLTRSQLEVMGHKNTIPEGEVRIVALGRNEEGVVIRTEIIEGVDEKDFLHGGEECFDLVLKLSRNSIFISMIETEKVNFAHINELHPEYLKERGRLRKDWKVISSVDFDNGDKLILWDSPKGLWVEETAWASSDGPKRIRTRFSLLISCIDIEQTVKKISGEIKRVERSKLYSAYLSSLTSYLSSLTS